MKHSTFHFEVLIGLVLTSCAAPQAVSVPTASPTPTVASPSQAPAPTTTPTRTETPSPTATPHPSSTPTPLPQPLLLRRSCGRDYVVRADEAIEIFYGGWAVKGVELAQQWATALSVDLAVDGLPIDGSQQPPAADLPYNCPKDLEDSYWLYYIAVIPQLSPGTHDATVTFNGLRALPDGYGGTYGPGQIAQQTFRITSK